MSEISAQVSERGFVFKQDALKVNRPLYVRAEPQVLDIGATTSFESSTLYNVDCKTSHLTPVTSGDDFNRAIREVSIKCCTPTVHRESRPSAKALAQEFPRDPQTVILDVVVLVDEKKIAAAGSAGISGNKRSRLSVQTTHLKVKIGRPVFLKCAGSTELVVEKVDSLCEFIMESDTLLKSISNFNFYLLQELFITHPIQLVHMDRHAGMYLRIKERSTNIDPAWLIQNNALDSLKESIQKCGVEIAFPAGYAVNARFVDADLCIREICVSFAYSDVKNVSQKHLVRLVTFLELRKEHVCQTLWDAGYSRLRHFLNHFGGVDLDLLTFSKAYTGSLSDDSIGEGAQRFSQSESAESSNKPSKAEATAETRNAVPRVKTLLKGLQMNMHDSNPLYNSLSFALERALVDYLVYHAKGKEAMKQVGTDANFSIGRVNLPEGFIPNTADPYWTSAVGNPPYEIVRDDFPLKIDDNSYLPHPKGVAGRGAGNMTVPDNGIGALAAAMDRSTASHSGHVVIPQHSVYFTRLSAGVKDASYVDLVETETILSHVKKLRDINDPQYTQILQKPIQGSELVFSIQQINSVPRVIPICRADCNDAKLSFLIADVNIKKPLLFDLQERIILARVDALDLFC
jgi:hypothetical protein